MKTRNALALVALTVVLLGSFAFTGCNQYGSFEERMDHKIQHITWHLDLNEDQQAKLTAVKDEILQVRQEHRTDFQKLLDELNTQIQGDQLDEARVLALIEEVHALKRQAAPHVIEKLAEFHATLTPEQKNKTAQQLQQFQERMAQART